MATATTTAPRRLPPRTLAAAGAVLVALLLAFAVVLTRTPTPVVPATPELRPASQVQLDAAAALGAARRELVGLQAAVRDVPVLDAAVRERMTLLGLVGSGQVPVAALQPAPVPSVLSQAQAETVERLTAARSELAALRAAVRDNPSVSDALRERTTLLQLVADGQIPAAALPPN